MAAQGNRKKEKKEYGTSAQRKRLVETEYRRVLDSVTAVNEEGSHFLKGVYAARRQKAILNCLDRVESEFSSFGFKSVLRSFTAHELLPMSDYNYLDEECDLRIGAALWILDKLRRSGKMVQAYEILPDVSGDVQADYLLENFYHPCYANDLIRSVIHVITNRYPTEWPGACILTPGNASGREPEETCQKLMALLPEEEVEKACAAFKEKIWEIAARYMKGQGYFERAVDETLDQYQKMPIAGELNLGGTAEGGFPLSYLGGGDFSGIRPFPGLDALPGIGSLSGNGILPGAGERLMETAEKVKDLTDRGRRFFLDFSDYLEMDRREVQRKTKSREVAEAAAEFQVSDPLELCFALFYLLDHGDDAPWLLRCGCYLMGFVLHMLPWYIDTDDWEDEDWDDWYEGTVFNRNSWLEEEAPPERLDYYHQKHRGRTLAQIIYDMSRCIVPVGLHPFERDRQILVEEGMDEETARSLTDTAELLFLAQFQAKQYTLADDWQEMEEDGEESAEEAEVYKPPQRVGGYWGRVLQVPQEEQEEEPDLGEEQTVQREDEAELQEEVAGLKKQLKALRSSLALARQEANSERTKYEHKLKELQMEHRELADLRELVFNREAPDQERVERVEKQYSYPYETKKRTVVFGGHDTFLKAIKPMLPTVKFVAPDILAFNPDIIRSADVVWIQNNCMGHSQFYNIAKNCRAAGVQMRYFGFASAEKCAEQLVTEDMK